MANTPRGFPGYPTCEPDSTIRPASSPNFHIDHNRTASLRAIATATERYFFIASCTYCRRQSASNRTAVCAASVSNPGNAALPCLVRCSSRCRPPRAMLAGNQPQIAGHLPAAREARRIQNGQHIQQPRHRTHPVLGVRTSHFGARFRLLLHRPVQLGNVPVQTLPQHQQVFARCRRSRSQLDRVARSIHHPLVDSAGDVLPNLESRSPIQAAIV